MDKEYLEDYEQRERAQFEKFQKDIQEDKFDFNKDRYPPDTRFLNLQRPVALASHWASNSECIWGQVPFCGSLVLCLPPFLQDLFEKFFFKVSDIQRIIDFIKETGKLQIALQDYPMSYAELDYWEPIFRALNPPVLRGCPITMFGDQNEIQKAQTSFFTLGSVKYFNHLMKIAQMLEYLKGFQIVVERGVSTYTILKLANYTVVKDVENSMIDDPEKALGLLDTCQKFIVGPLGNLHSDWINFTLEETRNILELPLAYQPEEIGFPCEIGKFLLRKLSYAPKDIRACYDILDHYNAYDLQKVQKSLNEAIVTNHLDVLDRNVQDLSEILDSIWKDSKIPKRIKNLRAGVPISIATIGSAVSAFTGGREVFLQG